MKATGTVRPIDSLGRVVLPMELRKNLDIDVKDTVEIYVSDNQEIILKKHEPACIFCNETTDIVHYEGKKICKKCIAKLTSAADNI